LPADYDPEVPHKLVVGYAGTNWVGSQMQPYLDLEWSQPVGDEIFVYLDPLWRDFTGWGELGGWLLGPNAGPADGMQDLVFTEALLDFVQDNYCIDTGRVFATGHSWGGDMAMVASCFLGHRFTASVPVAANEPTWFDAADGWSSCSGNTAVWTFFGIADDHFTWQSYAGEFGEACVDFWVDEGNCDGATSTIDLDIGSGTECVEYTGCDSTTRYCLYGAEFGHQVPDYYAAQTMAFFRGF
jgi:polyhydroxybutyrate depolymerase